MEHSWRMQFAVLKSTSMIFYELYFVQQNLSKLQYYNLKMHSNHTEIIRNTVRKSIQNQASHHTCSCVL